MRVRTAVAASALAVLAMIGSAGGAFADDGLGGGTSNIRGGHGHWCKTHDLNIDILGQVGILNGLLGNALNGEGNPGAQFDGVGSSC
ncbi:hypothetical protein [Streptomyces lydicus]|uniref:hypothetical protein n=1 Tax=Streptomyces lydicus TaxID=47763 RepID=UPI003713056D